MTLGAETHQVMLIDSIVRHSGSATTIIKNFAQAAYLWANLGGRARMSVFALQS